MKKIIFIIWFITFTSIRSLAYAAEEDCSKNCKIKDGPAPAIVEYLNNVRKVTSTVSSQSAKVAKANYSKNTFLKTRGNLVGAFSRLMSWDGYHSTFNFYVTLPITQSVPSALKRDHMLLENEIKRQRKILESVVKRGAQWTIIVDTCKSVEGVTCQLDNLSAQQVLTATINSTQKMSEYIRLAVLWDLDEFDGYEDFILVKDNFSTEMETHYNPFTLEDCSNCKWGFSESVRKSMSSIFEFNKLWKNGIQRWVDAWNLLIGNVSASKYQQVERQVLSRELWRQWLSWEQSEIILNNLSRYNNEWGYSLSNNFVVNTFNPPAKEIGKLVDDFNGALEKAYNRYWTQDIPIIEFAKIAESIKKSSGIERDILVFYESQLPMANAQDTSNELLLWRIRDYHINLVEIINELDKIIPISEKVCWDQDESRGKCRYR